MSDLAISSAEEDIQATANRRALDGDTAYHFRARIVLRATGDFSRIGEIATGPFARNPKAAGFASLLTEAGHLDADFFAVPEKGCVWIDVHEEFAENLMGRLGARTEIDHVGPANDRRWRIFGELPNQKGPETPFATFRFADGRRRELGARVLRDAAEPEGLEWQHSRKWDVHALRLGILPDHRCIRGLEILPEEAGYHRLGAAGRGKPVSEAHYAPIDQPRRVLPVRIEPKGAALPLMAGAPLIAGGEQIGVMLDHEGLYGVALIQLEAWRLALHGSQRITCLDEPALVTWPTWLSSESEGRYSPAGTLI